MHYTAKNIPRLGLVGLAYGGYNLGEELGPGKLADMRHVLARSAPMAVPNTAAAAAAGSP